MPESTPTFHNPPIVEFILGVQFSQIKGLSAAHFGRFWSQLGDDWTSPEDRPPIPDQFERFSGLSPLNSRPQLRLESSHPAGRIMLRNEENDRLLQLQPTRLHLNWRKTEKQKPSYKQLIGEFESTLTEFSDFCSGMGLGDVSPNQWEVTYVDSFPRGEYWDTPEDWGKFLPGLFNLNPSEASKHLTLERRQVDWSFEIGDELGRLHISAGTGHHASTIDETLLVNFTARGPLVPGKTETLRKGLDLGHEVSVRQFLGMVSEDTQARWAKGAVND